MTNVTQLPIPTCRICHEALHSRPFWQNLALHTDCLDKLIASVQPPAPKEVA